MITDFPTAPLAPGLRGAGGSTVEKSLSASHTEILTLPKGQATLWNPVELAILTLTARDIDARAFIKAFRDVKSLAPWAEDWKEYVSKEQWFGP